MMVKSGVLSQNRSFLYGIAAVFVLLVHFGRVCLLKGGNDSK